MQWYGRATLKRGKGPSWVLAVCAMRDVTPRGPTYLPGFFQPAQFQVACQPNTATCHIRLLKPRGQEDFVVWTKQCTGHSFLVLCIEKEPGEADRWGLPAPQWHGEAVVGCITVQVSQTSNPLSNRSRKYKLYRCRIMIPYWTRSTFA